MNRRAFFKRASLGAAVVAAAPMILSEPFMQAVAASPEVYSTHVVSQQAIIGEWNNYANFSSLAIASAIDDEVMKQAKELSYRFKYSVSELNKATFNGQLAS